MVTRNTRRNVPGPEERWLVSLGGHESQHTAKLQEKLVQGRTPQSFLMELPPTAQLRAVLVEPHLPGANASPQLTEL